jgi:DNA-binding NarL/FixJ family response regulator
MGLAITSHQSNLSLVKRSVGERKYTRLSPLQSAIIPLIFQGHTFREIADTLSTSANSVRDAVFHIKQRLRANSYEELLRVLADNYLELEVDGE